MGSNTDNVILMTTDYRKQVTSNVKATSLLERMLVHIDPFIHSELYLDVTDYLDKAGKTGSYTPAIA